MHGELHIFATDRRYAELVLFAGNTAHVFDLSVDAYTLEPLRVDAELTTDTRVENATLCAQVQDDVSCDIRSIQRRAREPSLARDILAGRRSLAGAGTLRVLHYFPSEGGSTAESPLRRKIDGTEVHVRLLPAYLCRTDRMDSDVTIQEGSTFVVRVATLDEINTSWVDLPELYIAGGAPCAPIYTERGVYTGVSYPCMRQTAGVQDLVADTQLAATVPRSVARRYLGVLLRALPLEERALLARQMVYSARRQENAFYSTVPALCGAIARQIVAAWSSAYLELMTRPLRVDYAALRPTAALRVVQQLAGEHLPLQRPPQRRLFWQNRTTYGTGNERTGAQMQGTVCPVRVTAADSSIEFLPSAIAEDLLETDRYSRRRNVGPARAAQISRTVLADATDAFTVRRDSGGWRPTAEVVVLQRNTPQEPTERGPRPAPTPPADARPSRARRIPMPPLAAMTALNVDNGAYITTATNHVWTVARTVTNATIPATPAAAEPEIPRAELDAAEQLGQVTPIVGDTRGTIDRMLAAQRDFEQLVRDAARNWGQMTEEARDAVRAHRVAHAPDGVDDRIHGAATITAANELGNDEAPGDEPDDGGVDDDEEDDDFVDPDLDGDDELYDEIEY